MKYFALAFAVFCVASYKAAGGVNRTAFSSVSYISTSYYSNVNVSRNFTKHLNTIGVEPTFGSSCYEANTAIEAREHRAKEINGAERNGFKVLEVDWKPWNK